MRKFAPSLSSVLLLAMAMILAALSIGAGTPADHRLRVYIVNTSTSVSDNALRDSLPAFQTAVSEDYAPFWHEDVKLVISDKPPRGAWTIRLKEDEDVFCLCYGYHEVQHGIPVAQVFAAAGEWDITLTHELFEMLADPYINRAEQVGSRFYALENCDAVEGYHYTRTGGHGRKVRISDFVTEAWFTPGAKGPYDFMRKTDFPLQLTPGGYISIWDNGIWISAVA